MRRVLGKVVCAGVLLSCASMPVLARDCADLDSGTFTGEIVEVTDGTDDLDETNIVTASSEWIIAVENVQATWKNRGVEKCNIAYAGTIEVPPALCRKGRSTTISGPIALTNGKAYVSVASISCE